MPIPLQIRVIIVKKYIKIISLIAAAAMIMTAVWATAYAETIFLQDGFSYSQLSSTSASVYGWDDRDPALVIPKELGDMYVTEIADTAFKEDTVITSVDFSNATRLERIGLYAFYGCSSLGGEVVIAGRIKTVDISAFENCTSIESVRFSSSRMTSLADQCFCGCTSLTSVELPNSLTSIGKYAFADCPALSSVMIPNSVTEINATAFSNDGNLVIYCYTGSYAQTFAETNGLDYVLLDAPLPTEDPTEAPTEDPTAEPVEYTFILGDADGDGIVTIMDATRIQRVLADLVEDTNGLIALRASNGEALSIMHATRVQRWLVDYEVPVSIGESVTVTI